jgi:hypothetical protein
LCTRKRVSPARQVVARRLPRPARRTVTGEVDRDLVRQCGPEADRMAVSVLAMSANAPDRARGNPC